MTKIKENIVNFFKKIKNGIGDFFLNENIRIDENFPRIHTRIIDFKGTGKHRFYLRVLDDGTGILIIDAKFVLYLNHFAMIYLHKYIDGESLEDIIAFFKKYYHFDEDKVREDYNDLMNKIKGLFMGEDVCPIHDLGIKPIEPQRVDRGFPFRVDLALTYQCNNDCPHCYVARKRDFPELGLEDIKKIIDILFEIGVPHIALTGGEATLREDLLDIIEYGQNKGVVMGIITNGRKFADDRLVKDAIKKGLDYAQITLESHDPEIHDKMVGHQGAWKETVQAIKNFEKEDIFFMTNTTLCKYNVDTIEETIKFLHKLGVKTFACNGLIYSGKALEFDAGLTEQELVPIVEKINDLAIDLGMRFIWYTPTQYCVLNPLELGLGAKRCSAASESIGIEPNGDVIPCQSYFESVGNILKDPWEKLWNSELFKSIRRRDYIEPKCKHCKLLPTCGGGCPLYVKNKQLNCQTIHF